MKKVFIASVLGLCLATSAMAQHRHYGGYHRHHGGWNWAPFVGGAIAGAIVYDAWNRPVYPYPPVVVHQPPVVAPPSYSGPPSYVQQPLYYDCTDTVRYSSVPGNEHIVRTCIPRYE